MTRGKPGPKPDPHRAYLRRLFAEWSDRTFASYYLAFRQLAVLAEEGVITDARRRQITRDCTRPNGSVNVSKFARIADDLAAMWVASLSDVEEAPRDHR